MKPTSDGPPTIGERANDNPIGITLDILSNHINQIGKNCGGIKELATKVDELVNIMTNCPHCRKRLLDRKE